MKENMQIVFGLLGGLAVFIYGMNLMSESLQKAAGEKMKSILALLTKNRIMGVIAGALVTAVLQSSSATTVMAIGFVSAGLMSLPQAISIIFGANIGTTMTAQIIAFKITDYIYAFIFVGFILSFVCKSERIKSIGQTIFAFGLLFLGIETMGDVMKPLASSPVFTDLNGKVSGMTATDVQKILNLKHAWEFILDRDVVASRSDYYMLSHIARLVNEGFFAEGGRIRGVPVTIGGSSYVPPLPNESDVKDRILEIIEEEDDAVNIAIRLCLYCMKTQIFLDGNKRASVIFANHYLIAHGGGFLVIPEGEVPEFKKLLVKFYEGEDPSVIAGFMKERCWKTIEH